MFKENLAKSRVTTIPNEDSTDWRKQSTTILQYEEMEDHFFDRSLLKRKQAAQSQGFELEQKLRQESVLNNFKRVEALKDAAIAEITDSNSSMAALTAASLAVNMYGDLDFLSPKSVKKV